MGIIDREEALARKADYARRVDQALAAATKDERIANPVEAFLWTYYSFRPRELRRYHPGALAVLSAGDEVAKWRGYGPRDGGYGVRRDFIDQRLPMLYFVRDFLKATAQRAPQHGCFGMHEWAMVYWQDQVRHTSWPLRLGTDAAAKVVDQIGLRCTHFDAFRFFTPSAIPLNAFTPTRANQPEMDQPGCLHANMDLYKWAYKLSPILPSDLVLDAFLNARKLREIDMRASPYDLTALGMVAIRVETPEGRVEYSTAQRRLAEESAPIRSAIAEYCEQVIELHQALHEVK